MSIIAKFQCHGVKKFLAGGGGATPPQFGEEIELSAVYGDANKPWSQFTPNGRLTMSITNPDALGRFEPGKQYFLEIKEA